MCRGGRQRKRVRRRTESRDGVEEVGREQGPEATKAESRQVESKGPEADKGRDKSDFREGR